MGSNDKIIEYNEKTGEISITWEGHTVIHTAEDWILADTGNRLLKEDLDIRFNIRSNK